MYSATILSFLKKNSFKVKKKFRLTQINIELLKKKYLFLMQRNGPHIEPYSIPCTFPIIFLMPLLDKGVNLEKSFKWENTIWMDVPTSFFFLVCITQETDCKAF